METRLILAYSLILVMVLFAAGLIAHRVHHSHRRAYRRRLRREGRARAARDAEPGAPKDR